MAAVPTHVMLAGQKLFLKNLDMKNKKIQAGFARGLVAAGYYLKREADKLVPWDTGHLIGSGFVIAEGSGANKVVYVGYTAEYAVYVHEDTVKATHGQAFNIKYAAEIAAYRAAYGKVKSPNQPYSPYSHPRRPDEQAKFLEIPLRRDIRIIVEIIRIAATS